MHVRFAAAFAVAVVLSGIALSPLDAQTSNYDKIRSCLTGNAAADRVCIGYIVESALATRILEKCRASDETYFDECVRRVAGFKSTPAPTFTPTVTPTPTPTPTATPTATPYATASPTPAPTATPESSPTPTPEPTATAEPTSTPVATSSPTASPSPSPSPTDTPVATPSPTAALGVAGAIGIVSLALIGLVIATLTRRKPKRRSSIVNFLEILSPPDDGSILVAGRMVNFTAQIDRPERSSEIEWSRASDSTTRVRGSSVSFAWAATGVDQVTATIDGLTCAVVVYVFKTPSGGSTLADLMQSEPPPVPRSAAGFTPHPKRMLRSVS